jgi:mRNA-degrading endonuclease RelE of RelBE toxin-antitoxin system
MVDRIEKALNKLSDKEKKMLKKILQNIVKGELKDLDVKKLKGRDDIYRVRKGKMRIIFKKEKEIKILTVERRSETTY